MKKLMFTAIALVAFSGVSMANTIADESQNKNVDVKVVSTDCCLIYDLAFSLSRSEGASIKDAETDANQAYNNCQVSNRQASISAN